MSSDHNHQHDNSHELIEIPGSGGHGGEEHGEGNWLVSYADMMTLLVGFFVIMLSFSKVDDEKFEEVKKQVTQKFGGKYEVPYQDLKNKIQSQIDKLGLGNQVTIKSTEAGVEISFFGTVFFNLGSADVKAESLDLLNNMIPAIKEEATDFDVTVEGHTDDIPIGPNAYFKNNWELSSIRACRVLAFFGDKGFKLSHLTAVGYGEARPVKPNRDANGIPLPLNQAQNRRVVIKLSKKSENSLESKSETENISVSSLNPSSSPSSLSSPSSKPTSNSTSTSTSTSTFSTTASAIKSPSESIPTKNSTTLDIPSQNTNH